MGGSAICGAAGLRSTQTQASGSGSPPSLPYKLGFRMCIVPNFPRKAEETGQKKRENKANFHTGKYFVFYAAIVEFALISCLFSTVVVVETRQPLFCLELDFDGSLAFILFFCSVCSRPFGLALLRIDWSCRPLQVMTKDDTPEYRHCFNIVRAENRGGGKLAAKSPGAHCAYCDLPSISCYREETGGFCCKSVRARSSCLVQVSSNQPQSISPPHCCFLVVCGQNGSEQ